MNEFTLKGADLSGQQIRQVILGQVDNTLDLINQKGTGLDEIIHSTRKNIKRIRAVLRMIRFSIENETYKQENLFFRDINRTVSAIRDSKVTLDIFRQYVQQLPENINDPVVGEIDEQLEAHYNKLTDDFNNKGKGEEQLVINLNEARRKLARLDVGSVRNSSLLKGMKLTYEQGRKSLDTAGRNLNDRNLHELRKQVKHSWYQVQLIRHIWDNYFSFLDKTFETISDGLGEDHDQAGLKKMIRKFSESHDNNEFIENILILIDKKQQSVRKSIWADILMVYAETPEAFARRINNYFGIYRKL